MSTSADSSSESRRSKTGRKSSWDPWEVKPSKENQGSRPVALKHYSKYKRPDDPVYDYIEEEGKDNHDYETSLLDKRSRLRQKSTSIDTTTTESSGVTDTSFSDVSNYTPRRKVEFLSQTGNDPTQHCENGFQYDGKRRQSQWDAYLETGKNVQGAIQSGVFKITLHQRARDGETYELHAMLKSLPDQQRRRILNSSTDEEGVTALHLAARHNHYEVCKLLIDYGSNVDSRAEGKATPLHYAARYRPRKRATDEETDNGALYINQEGNKSVISLLAGHGAHVNLKDIEGQTPLHCASIKGNKEAVFELLKCRGINIESYDLQGMTALHMAATHGHVEIVKKLIETGSDLHCVDNDQMTPLHFACSEGNIEIVRMILREGERQGTASALRKMLRKPDAGGNTCLHLSVSKGHKDMVRELLGQYGSTKDLQEFINMSRSHNDTPLHIAASQGHLDIARYLVESGGDANRRNDSLQTPLLLAAQHNHFIIVELLMENQAELEIRDKDNLTPLLVVTKCGHLETLSWLMENGADITATDKNDKSCLLLAVEENRTSAVKELLRHVEVRKLLDETDKNANSVLHVAARKGHLPIIKVLLENGARIDPKNEDEATPVHVAAFYGQHAALKELLDHDKTMLNSVDENANTALHSAATQGHTKCVQVLLQHGANVGLRNTKQWTALDCACTKGWETTVVELLKAQSAVNPPSGSRTTPLHQASMHGHKQVIEILLASKADVGFKLSDGRNPLDCAIDKNHTECVQAILNHHTWKTAMRNAYMDPLTDTVVTPMRKLITKMPDMAQLAFSRCMTNNTKPPDDVRLEVTFDYEFLDDMYTIPEWRQQGFYDDGREDMVKVQTTKSYTKFKEAHPSYEAFTEQGRLHKGAQTYVEDAVKLRHNHPLSIMVNRKREALLQHPLVTALLLYKWKKYGGMVYYSTLIFLITFVALLNSYLLLIPPPYSIDFPKSMANERFYQEFVADHIVNYTAPSTCYSILQSGADYRGYVSNTSSGKPCLPWESTSTNSHLFPEAGLDSNYCRNPASQRDKPWCFTNYSDTEASQRVQEDCNVEPCPIYVTGSNVPLQTTCVFPFTYLGAEITRCADHTDGSGLWCAYTEDFDRDQLWGYCSEEDPRCSVKKEEKRACGAPGTDRLNCEARGCCYRVHNEGQPSQWSECFQKLDLCSDRSTYCAVFKQSGFCETNRQAMEVRCAKTCGFCNESLIVEEDSEFKRFLYLMSVYPRNTFEPSWTPGCYYVLEGAQKKWGDSCLYKQSWQDPIRITILVFCFLNLGLLVLQIWNYQVEALQPIFFLEIALFVLGLLLGLDFDTYDAAFSSEMLSEVEKYDVLVKNFQQETGLRMSDIAIQTNTSESTNGLKISNDPTKQHLFDLFTSVLQLPNWQWQCGVMALFLSWMDLLLYIRKIPYLGIYVVMFNDVFKTFVKFSLVFLLFILSFAFTYHSLLQNQSQYEQPFSSIIRTTVMMVGEMDFGDLFFGDSTNYSLRVNYEAITYIIFTSFIIVMMIIIMNLLVGLAVGDIIEVKDHATLERLKMQVELALEVEFSVPNFLRKRFVRKHEKILPNKYRKSNPVKRALFQNAELSSKIIFNAMNPGRSETETIRDNVSTALHQLQHHRHRLTEIEFLMREIMVEMRDVKAIVETTTMETRLRDVGDSEQRSLKIARGSEKKRRLKKMQPFDGDRVPTRSVSNPNVYTMNRSSSRNLSVAKAPSWMPGPDSTYHSFDKV